MGKKRIIAETGAGMHGVATATLCARFGLPCIVYMGAVDVERQKPNVFRMKMLGAEVRPVQSGTKTLKDAMNEALRDWVTNVERHILLHRHGRGPASLSDDGARFPVRHRQRDARADAGGRRPAAGFADRLHRRRLQRDGPVPSLPRRSRRSRSTASRRRATGLTGLHAASIAGGRPGVLHGNRTYLAHGRRRPDQGGAFDLGRPRLSRHRPRACLAATTSSACNSCRRPTTRRVKAFQLCSQLEGIIPALESAHALAKVIETRAEKAEGSPDGGQSLRPRRQGSDSVAQYLKAHSK